jgi:2,5-diamino-6-hydroxy-4-(5-phosphoribosylamino)pyrimidine 1'-reductase
VDRPFVCVNMAASVDGKITSAAREYPSMTSVLDRVEMDRLRAESDAILLGAGTLRADDPTLGVRSPEMRARRRALGKPAGLPRVVVSASLELDPASRFFDDDGDGGARIIATVEGAAPARRAALAARAEVWTVGREHVDLRRLLHRLRERGVERLLVEGGGELNWHFVRDDLVDELYVTIAPCLIGGKDAPTLLEGAGFTIAQRRLLRLVEARREGDELYCRWSILR